jgi:hypothetical protein
MQAVGCRVKAGIKGERGLRQYGREARVGDLLHEAAPFEIII